MTDDPIEESAKSVWQSQPSTQEPGDPVELWGTNLAVEELAATAGTIAYELLCGVSQRVPIELD